MAEENRFGRAALAKALTDHAGAGVDTGRFWLTALVVGVVSGYAAVGFRLAVHVSVEWVYGINESLLHSWAAHMPVWRVALTPVVGAVVVALILQRFTPRGSALAVGDVIEAAALRDSRVSARAGLASAAASLITLSTGGSSGREGPAVHLCGVIASWVSEKLNLHGLRARDLLGCAAAAAVSASFNAPLAGALFALEVVLRHYAVHAFGPIVIASAAGAVVSRIHVGDVTEYTLPPHDMQFFAELPAYALLGVVCGLVAALMVRATFWADGLAERWTRALGLSAVARAALAGLLLGLVAIRFPHVIGVGYETTSRALTLQLGVWACVSFAMVKVAAFAITMAGRLGGGVFSPSLMLGALTGAAFGQIATALVPEAMNAAGLYALAGMGAAAAAVLGAPISTTLIVFELTGDYQAGLAVMVSVSLASVVAHRFIAKSFFLTQLARAGVRLSESPESWLPQRIRVSAAMRPRGADESAPDTGCLELIEQDVFLRLDDTLAAALPLFDRMKVGYLPVVAETENGRELLGAVFHVDALKALNRFLCETHREEHS